MSTKPSSKPAGNQHAAPLEFGSTARIAAATVGVLCILAGGVAVFISDNAAGTAALIAAGAALIVAAAFADYIKTVEAGGVKVELERAYAVTVAASSLEAAAVADGEGRYEEADRLRRDASRLLDVVKLTATEYESVRAASAGGAQRTRDMSRVINKLKAATPAAEGPEDVRRLFEEGSDGNRVAALVLMETDPRLAVMASIEDAITNPRSAFEQYHALRASEAAASTSEPQQMAQLRTTIQHALEAGRFGAMDSDRCRVAQRVLEIIPADEGMA